MTKRRRPGVNAKVAEARFWGDDAAALEAVASITPTSDPTALIRSLGPSPLALDDKAALKHLTAVYSAAVRQATALLRVNGLLVDPDDA